MVGKPQRTLSDYGLDDRIARVLVLGQAAVINCRLGFQVFLAGEDDAA